MHSAATGSALGLCPSTRHWMSGIAQELCQSVLGCLGGLWVMPAMATEIADHVWSVRELLGAA